ncbi:TetR/AcrR family transcriptional regulator [Cellulomonas avistercoris]|uniref:TetR/AcrR family transcriptional regulator n=1 Tax=Cellulomonas avistercoris TaxID=2762242 RepID=UPI00296B4307|nr:TetR/AcrR family transcriptional regulator C-terminal domain-containing protein [Cellulomonas avistercoris]
MVEAPVAGASRPRLTRERVLRRAVDIADAAGVEALTMRRLADELGVEAMSLYHHVRGKGGILDGAVELVLDELAAAADASAVPPGDGGWRAAVRARLVAARTVMLRHPWAPDVMAARSVMTLGAARHVDAVVGLMRAGGLSYDLVHHGLHALGSRMFGFSPEIAEPDAGDQQGADALAGMAELVPHLAAMLAEVAHDDATTLGWCDDQTEFEFGLDLVLDGLDRLAHGSSAAGDGPG